MRFTTVLMLRPNTVVLAKPMANITGLERGAYVRVALPRDPERQLRLEVLTPHLNLRDGTPVFVCRAPERFLKQHTQRRSERYQTLQFSNLRLSVAENRWKYRVLDLSTNGCKVTPREGKPQNEFPLGHRFTKGDLIVGELRIALDYIIPRSYQANAVGLEFAVGSEFGERKLQGLIDSLKRRELERLREGREAGQRAAQ